MINNKRVNIAKTILNDNNTYPLKTWNDTLYKYQILAEQNNEQLKNTLLFSFIQNGRIKIRDNYNETIFNDFMVEENTFIETCKEILDIEYKKKAKIQKKENGFKKKTTCGKESIFPPLSLRQLSSKGKKGE